MALKRRARLKLVNRKRKKRRYKEAFGDYAETIRGMACCACRGDPPSDPHHVKSQGAGGTKRDLVPLCRHCHNYGHAHGWKTFQREANINLKEVARELWRLHGGTDATNGGATEDVP